MRGSGAAEAKLFVQCARKRNRLFGFLRSIPAKPHRRKKEGHCQEYSGQEKRTGFQHQPGLASFLCEVREAASNGPHSASRTKSRTLSVTSLKHTSIFSHIFILRSYRNPFFGSLYEVSIQVTMNSHHADFYGTHPFSAADSIAQPPGLG